MKFSKLTKSFLISGALAATSVTWAAGEYGESAQKNQENQKMEQVTETKEHEKSPLVQTITFEEGQYELSLEAREQLKSLVENAKQQGEIEEIKVAVWSDVDFPVDEHEAKDQQNELAENREDAIENYIEDELQISALALETFNMAEQASVIAEWFNTDEAELKSIFAKRGEEEVQAEKQPQKEQKKMTKREKQRKDLQVFREEGGPSKAVAYITLSDKKKDQEQRQQEGIRPEQQPETESTQSE